MLRATPLRALRVTYAMISRGFESDAALCRDTFFSAALPDADVARYMAAMKASGSLRLLDLRVLGASLPVPSQPAQGAAPMLVLGAEDDAVVDQARGWHGIRRASRAGSMPFAPRRSLRRRARRGGCARRQQRSAYRLCSCPAWRMTSCWTRAGATPRMRWRALWTRCEARRRLAV